MFSFLIKSFGPIFLGAFVIAFEYYADNHRPMYHDLSYGSYGTYGYDDHLQYIPPLPVVRGFAGIVPVKAIAVFNSTNVRGTVTFAEPYEPRAKVTVEVRLQGLAKGQYMLEIHEYGDPTEKCIRAGDVRYMPGSFESRRDKKAWTIWKTDNVTIRDPDLTFMYILGRALGIRATGGDVIDCAVIGLQDELTWTEELDNSDQNYR